MDWYRAPPSHSTVTTVCPGPIAFATRMAAATFSPALPPTEMPSSISSENLISEVVMARMLILRCDSALNACAATPAWLHMPMPITETLATSVALSSLA